MSIPELQGHWLRVISRLWIRFSLSPKPLIWVISTIWMRRWSCSKHRCSLEAPTGSDESPLWMKTVPQGEITDTFISVLTVKTVWSIVFKFSLIRSMVLGDGYGIGERKAFPIPFEIIYYHIPQVRTSSYKTTRDTSINCRLLETRKIQTAKNKPQFAWWRGLEQINQNAAGIDGAGEHWCCSPSRSQANVRRFGCFTPDLIAMVDWLSECGVDTVTMEATGVYWIPVFQIWSHGVLKSNWWTLTMSKKQFQDVKQMSKIVSGCNSYATVTVRFVPSWRPSVFYVYIRQRDSLIKNASTHVQRMQADSDEFAFT